MIQVVIEEIEAKIYSQISNLLNKDNGETIESGPYTDFLLPKGCEQLGWYGRTAIEIKYRLLFDSLLKIRKIYDNSGVDKMVVIVIDKDSSILPSHLSSRKPRSITGRDIEIKYYNQIKKQFGIDDSNTEIPQGTYISSAWKEDNNLTKAKKALDTNNVSLFLGAGVSVSAGMVNWMQLLDQLCAKKSIEIDASKNNDAISKGRYIIDAYKGSDRKIPQAFYRDMKDILYIPLKKSKLIEAIANLAIKKGVKTIITYNYDNLIETEINKKQKNLCYSIYSKSRPLNKEQIQVYHVHGFLPRTGPSSEIILGEKEYHKVYQEAYNWSNVEQLHALCRSTCFFIGLSMSDPNLRRLLDTAMDQSEGDAEHFVFLRRNEYDVQYMESMMSSFGINCIWYDNHDELPDILTNLYQIVD